MEISSISGLMFKAVYTLLIILFVFTAFAEQIVEVMGNVSVTKTYAYEEPDFKSKAVARLNKNAKVLIVGRQDDWLKVVLENRKQAYMYAKYVTFKDENITKKESESKALIDINNLLDQFNDTVQSSWFAEKQMIVPSLTFLAGKSPDDITLLFTAVNHKGDPVPSLKENPLKKDMTKLVELIFMKMIVLSYNRFSITIKVPDFITGEYKGRASNYASLSLQKDFANLDEIKNGEGGIWEYVRSEKKPEEMFADYPH